MMEEQAKAARERTPDDAGNGVGDRLQLLNQKHDTTHQWLVTLEERLRPIMREPESSPHPGEDLNAAPSSQPAPLVRELDRLVDRAGSEAETLQRLIERLDI